jgi:hypothetical protein
MDTDGGNSWKKSTDDRGDGRDNIKIGAMKVGWEMGRQCIWFRALSSGRLNLRVLPTALFSHCGVQ